MGDCLKTQLKAAVQNSNLEKLGVMVIQRKYNPSDNEDSAYLYVHAYDGPVSIIIDGDGYFSTTYGTPTTIKQVDLSAGQIANVYTSNGNYNIEIHNKYESLILFSGGDYRLNIDDYYYTKQTTVKGTSIYGHLRNLNPSKITTLIVESPDIEGTVEDLGKLINLTRITVNPVYEGIPRGSLVTLGALTKLVNANTFPRVDGQIEDFVNAQRTATIDPRVSLSSPLTLYDLGVRGTVYIYDTLITGNAELTWTENTITVNGTTYDSNGDVVQ